MTRFTQVAEELAPWSMSKAQAAYNCPFRFDLKYVRKKKGHVAKSAAGRVGIAAHAVLEGYLKGVPLKDVMHRAAIDNELTTPEIEDLLSYAHHIDTFSQRLSKFKAAKNVSEQHVEMKFGLTQDMQPTKFFPSGKDKPVFFRGVWDLCLRARDRFLIIIDHKSGAVKSLETYGEQLRLYAIAAINVFPRVDGVQSALHFLQSEEIVWDRMYNTETIREKFYPWFVNFINKAAGETVDPTIARKGWYCGFCEYTDLCPVRE